MSARVLAVFGISGRTGRALAGAAAARSWNVRGFARAESEVPSESATLTIVRGDFADPARVVETVDGADAVCCVIGPRPPYAEVFCAAATQAILDAMRRVGSRRIVCQTGAMVGPGNRTFAFDWLARTIARRQPVAAHDRAEQERLVQESGLAWTLVKPPRLTDGRGGGCVRAGSTLRVGLLSSISRADLAGFMLDVVEQGQHVRSRVFVRADGSDA